jgi:ATP-binding cassette subfamily C protein LapB
MKEPTDRSPTQSYLSKARFQGAIRTEKLTFTYPTSKLPALGGLDIVIQPGERVAILGRIGSGKSTLLRLLNTLYLPTTGSVYADGIDLRQVDPADVHHNIGLVTQDCKLFYGTLRDNLTIGVPQVSAERLMGVCRTTGLDVFIARHPLGLDMMLGENGAGLSGGQRQLVALARSLLSDPPVLLMDEPTSAMDAQTESAFIAQLKMLSGSRTLVIATHRMSLLELVDRVIVLDQGRVIADGPKHKLMQVLASGGGLPVTAPTKKAANG